MITSNVILPSQDILPDWYRRTVTIFQHHVVGEYGPDGYRLADLLSPVRFPKRSSQTVNLFTFQVSHLAQS